MVPVKTVPRGVKRRGRRKKHRYPLESQALCRAHQHRHMSLGGSHQSGRSGGPRRSESQNVQATTTSTGDYCCRLFYYNIATLTFKHFPSVICQDRTCERRDKSTDQGYFRLLHLKYWTRKNHPQTVLLPSFQLVCLWQLRPFCFSLLIAIKTIWVGELLYPGW